MKHLIFGGGGFTHAHIRTINEIHDSEIIIYKRLWTEEQISSFSKYNNVTLSDTSRNHDPDIIHIVTASQDHLSCLISLSDCTCPIFLEKPSVIINNDDDLLSALSLKDKEIYFNNWFANVTKKRPRKKVRFKYHTKNHVPKDQVATEILTHLASYLTKVDMSPDDLKVEIDIKTGTNEKSQWELQLDDKETVTSSNSYGKEMRDTFIQVFNRDQDKSHWLHSAILTNRLRALYEQN